MLGRLVANGLARSSRRFASASLPPSRKRLLIVYHSLTGGSLQMAEAAAKAARREPDLLVDLRHASAAGPEDVLSAHGYLFCGPETLASISGVLKDFFDRSYYPVLGQVNGRPYAVLVCAGSDGTNATRQLARIAAGWRLKQICEPLIVCTRADSPDKILAQKIIPSSDLAHCEEIGATLAAGLVMGVF